MLLLADGRQNGDPFVFYLQGGPADVPLGIGHVDPVQTFDTRLLHFCRDRMTAIPRKPVDASAHEEVRSELLGQTEQLIDVALTVTDMDAAPGLTEVLDGLA